MKALIVEDSKPVADATRLILAQKGWQTDHTDTAEAAFAALPDNDYHLMILDLMLPDSDGFSVLHAIRSSGLEIPVIVLTGLADSDDACKALRLGADEFLRKPVNINELSLRIDAVMRRCERSAPSRVTVGELDLRLDENSACIANAPLHLTKREFQVLALLAKRKGCMISKERLYSAIYESPPGSKSKLSVIELFIHKLRKKLEAAGDGKVWIKSSWGEGYALHDG